jgi:hypothetical protein
MNSWLSPNLMRYYKVCHFKVTVELTLMPLLRMILIWGEFYPLIHWYWRTVIEIQFIDLHIWTALNVRWCNCSSHWGNHASLFKELNPRRRVYVERPKPARVELKCSQIDVILATPERVLVSQYRPDAESLISILKCLKLTIDIIFQSRFIAHLTRSRARDHTNPDSGPATTSQAIPGSTTLFTADQMDDLHWFFRGFYTKRVVGVQKLSEVGNMLTVIRSVLCTACWNF